jgi:8-oxo-dGTP diphosphatase
MNDLPALAFDHADIIDECASASLKHSQNDPIMARLLPREFTLSDLQRAVEIITRERVDKRNFRRTLEDRGWVRPVGRKALGRHRPAELYTFSSQ